MIRPHQHKNRTQGHGCQPLQGHKVDARLSSFDKLEDSDGAPYSLKRSSKCRAADCSGIERIHDADYRLNLWKSISRRNDLLSIGGRGLMLLISWVQYTAIPVLCELSTKKARQGEIRNLNQGLAYNLFCFYFVGHVALYE